MQFERVSVIGLGYIGLPTAATFANHRVNVIGVDTKQEVVDTINQGEIHIFEPDLAQAVSTGVKSGKLRATTVPEPADAFIVAVPTPFKPNDYSPDLSYIDAAAESLAPVLEAGNLVILESTSPVGATEQMAGRLAQARADLSFPHQAGEASDIRIAHCPERVLPGKVMSELIANDRVVGGMTPACAEAACYLYKLFLQGECVLTTTRAAEMCKLTENSFRDVNIAFANELSIVCDKLDIDVWELIRLANRHPRVKILQPGPGVGGHCIAVDPWFIVSSAPDEARLIRLAREVNDGKPGWVLDKVKIAVGEHLQANPDKTAKDVRIACFGVAFKPDIDDFRGSPALAIAQKISVAHAGATLVVEPNMVRLPSSLEQCDLVPVEMGLDADILVLLVDHRQFKGIRPSADKHVVDTKGVWA